MVISVVASSAHIGLFNNSSAMFVALNPLAHANTSVHENLSSTARWEFSEKIGYFIQDLKNKHLFPASALKPLHRLFSIMDQEENELIKRALTKSDGYVRRLFSTESWMEWTRYRTPLGMVVDLFVDYTTSESRFKDRLMSSLDLDTLQKANAQAKELLQQLNRSSTVQYKSKLAQAFDCSVGLTLGGSATLVSQNPAPLFLATLNCLNVKAEAGSFFSRLFREIRHSVKPTKNQFNKPLFQAQPKETKVANTKPHPVSTTNELPKIDPLRAPQPRTALIKNPVISAEEFEADMKQILEILNDESLTCEKNESGFIRINIKRDLVPETREDVFKLRLHFWPNETVQQEQETVHSHPVYFESYVINGGYTHQVYEEGTPEDPTYKRCVVIIEEKDSKGGKKKDPYYAGDYHLKMVNEEVVKPGDVVAFPHALIHRVLGATQQGTLTLNAVLPGEDDTQQFNVFSTQNCNDSVKTKRENLTNEACRGIRAQVTMILKSYEIKRGSSKDEL